MSVSGKVAKVAVVLALVAVGFTVTAVGVHLCRRGRSSEDMLATGRSDTSSDVVREQPAGDGNGTTPAAETAADRADFEVLHQRGNVRVLRMRTTQAKMQGDGRELRPTCVLSAERADGAAREELTHLTAAAWREIDQLQQAGKGQNLGVYKKKVGGREIPFKLQRFVLSDGTVVIISTADPNDPVPPRP
jgi:regulator of protease activity HflC (stomatin/prohibitin superfamily)